MFAFIFLFDIEIEQTPKRLLCWFNNKIYTKDFGVDKILYTWQFITVLYFWRVTNIEESSRQDDDAKVVFFILGWCIKRNENKIWSIFGLFLDMDSTNA